MSSKPISYEQALADYSVQAERPLNEQHDDKEALLKAYHPDHRADTLTTLKVGPNSGDQCHRQVAESIQADARIDEADLAGASVVETDVLVIGGGGAGSAAAMVATVAGAKVILATKLRMGDSNTVMAEGGIQASIDKDDTPQMHYDDTLAAGHGYGEKKNASAAMT